MHLPSLADRADVRLVAVLLLILALWPGRVRADDAPAAEPVRVVLPYAGNPLAISGDGRWVAATHGEHLQIIDTTSRRILWQVPIEYRLSHAAFSPDGTWLAISDDNNIFRIDLDTGKRSVLLEDTTGRVAFHPDKPVLIFLGHTWQAGLPLPEKLTVKSPDGVTTVTPAKNPESIPKGLRRPDDNKLKGRAWQFAYSRQNAGMMLAAYNLDKNRWQAAVQTPIAAGPWHALKDNNGKELPRGTDTLHIEGERVYFCGIGGDLISRVTNTFPADACLNIKTREAWVNFGRYERGRREPDGKQEQAKNRYTPPDYLGKLEGVAQADEKRRKSMLAAVQSLAPRPLAIDRLYQRDGSFLAHCPDRDTVDIATTVINYTENDDGQTSTRTRLGLMRLSSDGELADVPITAQSDGDAQYFNGRLATAERSSWHGTLLYHYKLIDLETDELLVARHHTIEDSRKKVQVSETQIAGKGLIGRNETNGLDYYNRADDGGPAWTFDQPEEAIIGVVGASHDGSRLVMLIDHHSKGGTKPTYRFETLILDSKTGNVLGRVQTKEHLNACGVAFDETLEHITVAEHWGDKHPTVNTYHIATGEITQSVTLPRDKRLWCDLSKMDQPVKFLQNFNPEKAPDRYRFSFGSRIISVRQVQARGEPAWLVLGQRNAHLFAIDDNEHLAAFSFAEVRHSRRNPTRPRVTPIFNGNALLVAKGVTPGFDLIDLQTLETKLHVRLVPTAEGTGTITYTPDGFWDATEQAEQYLSLYRGKMLLDAPSTERYRSPEKVAEIIRALAR